jgi:hypothetical protein
VNRISVKILSVALAVSLISAASWLAMRHRPDRPVALLATGEFHPVAHKGSGAAAIFQMPGGNRVLRLTNVRTGEREDLQVCLVAAADCPENETVERAGFVTLGSFQRAKADQTFNIPSGLDLNRYRAVTIWNPRYRVNFTTAPLSPP